MKRVISVNCEDVEVHEDTSGSFIEVTSGKYFCSGENCEYCKRSTFDNDAHYFGQFIYYQDFKDDQGNYWIYQGITQSDEAPTNNYHWYWTTHRWNLFDPTNKRFAVFKNAHPNNTSKIAIYADDTKTLEYRITNSGLYKFFRLPYEHFEDELTFQELKERFQVYATKLELRVKPTNLERENLDLRRLRRRCEDVLRKSNKETLFAVAKLLNVRY